MMGWGGGPDNCHGYGWSEGRGSQNLTDEQRGQLDTLRQEFIDRTAPIKNEIWSKKAQINTLMSTSNPDAEKVRALQKEISDLKAQLAQERIDFQLETRKINPDARFGAGYGRGGFGPQKRGRGPGYGNNCPLWEGGRGPGWQRGGFGPGSCWN